MKLKWNGMDTFIVILLLLALAAGVFFLAGGNQAGPKLKVGNQEVTAEFVVELAAQEESFTTLPQVGDVVSLGEKDKAEAVVTEVAVLPAVSIGYNTQAGWAGEVAVPNRYDVRIKLQTEVTETDQAIKANETLLRVGEYLVLKHKDWAGHGFVLALDII